MSTTLHLQQLAQGFALPLARIGALLMVAPIFGARLVPGRVRILMAVALAAILLPLMPATATVDALTPRGLLIIGQEILIGVSMGMLLQMVFDAVVTGAQTAAMSMGLGFAMLIDPQRGVNVPILSQFFIILATLVFLTLDGHLMLLQVLAQSFETLPPGTAIATRDASVVIAAGSQMFTGAVMIALPAVMALLVVHIAFGVVSRAAPSLNLFAVGFPVAMLLGFFVLRFSLGNTVTNLTGMFEAALQAASRLIAAGVSSG